MPFPLHIIKSCSESRKIADDKISNISIKESFERCRTRPRSLASGAQSAACRGLYAAPACRSTNKQRSETHSAHFEKSGRAGDKVGRHEYYDQIIKCSTYPQTVDKRRSKLTPPARTRSVKYDRATTRQQESVEQWSARLRRYPADSDLSCDSEYQSDGNPEGRPIRICMYPQGKYIKKPVNVHSKSTRRGQVASSGKNCMHLLRFVPSSAAAFQRTSARFSSADRRSLALVRCWNRTLYTTAHDELMQLM